ncbi:hypothetical protein Hanom_Chr04g00290081 [Helianthus anomalus]
MSIAISISCSLVSSMEEHAFLSFSSFVSLIRILLLVSVGDDLRLQRRCVAKNEELLCKCRLVELSQTPI